MSLPDAGFFRANRLSSPPINEMGMGSKRDKLDDLLGCWTVNGPKAKAHVGAAAVSKSMLPELEEVD